MQYFTIFQDKLHSVNIQDDQSLAFSETVQKISKININTANGSHFWRAPNLHWTLTESLFNIIKNLLSLFLGLNLNV